MTFMNLMNFTSLCADSGKEGTPLSPETLAAIAAEEHRLNLGQSPGVADILERIGSKGSSNGNTIKI